MYRSPKILIVPCLMFGLVVLGCGSEDEQPEKALIITGAEELIGATVFLDGVELGVLEVLDKPPGLVIWAISLFTGDRGPYKDDHNTVVLVSDLEGTSSGPHLVVVDHPSFRAIEKPFKYPDDLQMNESRPKSGVVFLACIPSDLKPRAD